MYESWPFRKIFIVKAKFFPFVFEIWGNPMNVLEKRSYQLPTPHVHDTLIFKVLFAMLYSFQWTGNISWVIFHISTYFLVAGLHYLKIIEERYNSKICLSYCITEKKIYLLNLLLDLYYAHFHNLGKKKKTRNWDRMVYFLMVLCTYFKMVIKTCHLQSPGKGLKS